jgi:hypothetical protein
MPPNSAQTLRASAALAAATTEYGVSYEDTRASGLATATTTDKLTNSAGAFTTAGANGLIAVGDIIKNTTTGKYALVTAIDSATALSISADIFSNTNAYTIYSNHGLRVNRSFNSLLAILDVTAAATDVGDTLDVYLDTSFDGGVSWINIGHFTQVLGNGGVKKFVMSFKANPIAAANSVLATADQAAAAALQIGFGDRFRYRATMVDADADGTFTWSLKLFFKS